MLKIWSSDDDRKHVTSKVKKEGATEQLSKDVMQDIPAMLRFAAAQYESLVHELEENKSHSSSSNTSMDDAVWNLTEEKQELQAKCDKLSEELKLKTDELLKAHDAVREKAAFVEIVKRDLEQRTNAELQNIAAKLRHEYLDYKDALNMRMDIDLGENMRDQLKRVFRILSDSGMGFE